MPRRGPALLTIQFVAPDPTQYETRLPEIAAAFAVLVELRRERERRKAEEALDPDKENAVES